MKKTAVFILALLLILTACGCDRLVGVRGNGTTVKSSSEDPRFVKQEGQGMSEYDAYCYFERIALPAAYAVDYYAGAGMPRDDDAAVAHNGGLYAPVISSTITSVGELEDYAALFFGGSFLENMREVALMDEDEPRYIDIDGALYINISYEEESSLLFSFDLDTFTITENTEEKIRFTVEGTYGDKPVMLNSMTLSLTDGAWRITYWSPQEITDASASSAS